MFERMDLKAMLESARDSLSINDTQSAMLAIDAALMRIISIEAEIDGTPALDVPVPFVPVDVDAINLDYLCDDLLGEEDPIYRGDLQCDNCGKSLRDANYARTPLNPVPGLECPYCSHINPDNLDW